MEQSERDDVTTPGENEDREIEQDRVRSSNDRDQALEREGLESEHNRGYDEASKGSGASKNESMEDVVGSERTDVDPDSPDADIDRDDTTDEI